MSTGGVRFRQTAAILGWRNLHNFFTNPALVVPALLFPLFFFTAFAGGLSRVQHVPGFNYPNGYTAFQFGFVLMQASAFGGVFTGFAIARDFESGVSRRIMLATPHRSAILVGYAIAAVVRAITIGALLFAIALAVGMKVTGNPSELLALVLLALTINLLALLFASGIAFRFRTIQSGPLMQTPVFMVLFLTPVYVPFDLLHGWVQSAARFNPLTKMIEAGRSLIAGAPSEVVLAFGFGAAVAAVLLVWSMTGLRSAERAGG
ncbi:MAG: ABC transporter permease [Thermoleophilia bacterium]|nr:ABC transporter permease [Thermoleophilia bacterium]